MTPGLVTPGLPRPLRQASALAWALSLLAAASCGRPYENDPVAINARYALKYQQPCSAWLRSPRTGYMYCSSPPIDVVVPGAFQPPEAEPFRTLESGEVNEAALMARGEVVYVAICQTCHQADGKGLPGSYPPLAGSGDFYGTPENHAGIIVNGLTGTITVQGVAYNGAMPPQASLSDYDVAAVATFERLSWGNSDGVVLPEAVASAR
jgi:mono/diheme cytochrome c family protein